MCFTHRTGCCISNPLRDYRCHELTMVCLDNTTNVPNGCLSSLVLPAWGYKAFVLKDDFIIPSPVITKFLPGHDYRLLSSAVNKSIAIEVHFSTPMDCDQITNGLQINSTVADNQTAQLDKTSVHCRNTSNSDPSPWSGGVNTTWTFTANLMNVADGMHQLTLDNVSTADGGSSTNVGMPTVCFRILRPWLIFS